MTVLQHAETTSVQYKEVELLPSAARAASGSSGPFDGFGPAVSLRILLDVTAFTTAAGNTLDVVVEDTIDGVNFHTIATFTQRTATGREVINVSTPFARRIQVRWTVAGAPAATFRVIAVAQ